MSYDDYRQGLALQRFCYNQAIGFYGAIQCAMRMADSTNLEKLKEAFPDSHRDITTRYHAPGGLLDGEANATD